MEDRDETNPRPPQRYLEFVCPTCKRHVRLRQKDPRKLPRFFPFCSERCKLIDLGAWLDADYRIAGKPDEEAEGPGEQAPATDRTNSRQ
jgi:endogenous inhibitor of DNA gyrase (YacG/DUF329 family)